MITDSIDEIINLILLVLQIFSFLCFGSQTSVMPNVYFRNMSFCSEYMHDLKFWQNHFSEFSKSNSVRMSVKCYTGCTKSGNKNPYSSKQL